MAIKLVQGSLKIHAYWGMMRGKQVAKKNPQLFEINNYT